MQGLNGDRGNVALIVALMTTVLLGMGALAIDVGAMVVRHTQLQGGADAAALAIAQECAEFAVLGQPSACNLTQSLDTATEYLTDNLLGGIDPTVAAPQLVTAYDGRAGRVTVTASAEEPVMFAWALGEDRLRTAASATARWGPLTAVDAVFPLAVCRGALDDALQEVAELEELGTTQVTLWSAPSAPDGGGMLGQCDGAPDALPLGWLPPNDLEECTTAVTLMPTSYFAIAPAAEPPADPGCGAAINKLLEDISACSWRNPNCWDRRRRVLAVYDAGSAPGGKHPVHALVGFQFTGVRIGDEQATARNSPPWEGPCADPDAAEPAPSEPAPSEAAPSEPADTENANDVVCIRGFLFPYFPPDDGPILDPTIDTSLLPASIEDTTVLNIRLVD
jgi:Flp pilus assembly protein TadG